MLCLLSMCPFTVRSLVVGTTVMFLVSSTAPCWYTCDKHLSPFIDGLIPVLGFNHFLFLANFLWLVFNVLLLFLKVISSNLIVFEGHIDICLFCFVLITIYMTAVDFFWLMWKNPMTSLWIYSQFFLCSGFSWPMLRVNSPLLLTFTFFWSDLS